MLQEEWLSESGVGTSYTHQFHTDSTLSMYTQQHHIDNTQSHKTEYRQGVWFTCTQALKLSASMIPHTVLSCCTGT